MRILISVCRFIGSNIADGFLADGHEVGVLDDLSTGFRSNVPQAAAFFQGIFVTRICSPRLDDFRPDVIDHHAAQMDVRKSWKTRVRRGVQRRRSLI